MMLVKRLGARLSSAAPPWLRVGLGLAITGLFLYLALRGLALADIGAALLRARPAYVALAVLSVALNFVSKAARWQVLLGPAGKRRSFRQILTALLLGQVLNFFAPARLGDASRIYTLGRSGAERSFVLGTLVLEKLLDLLCYAMLCLLVLLLMPLPAWLTALALPVLLLTGLLLAGLAGMALVRPWRRALVQQVGAWVPAHLRARASGYAAAAVSSLGILGQPGARVRLGLLSLLVWATALLNNYLIMLALDLRLPLLAAALLLIVLQAGLSLPSVPGNIGVFEYGCVLTLALFGVQRAPALSYGLLLHVVVLLPPLLAGLCLLWLPGLPSPGPLGGSEDQQPVNVPPRPPVS